ncbi:MAG: sugar phosphate nucleotidyltransferase [Geobacteraceae bacterium]|nr:sugar phosphate nucleotidyltransferase [Geobacteraceae bacterium]
MYAVILAGGSGTRFWPLSRKRNPKQLMSVFGGKSMLQRTVERVLPLKPKRILVVTNALQAEETTRQLREYQQACRIDVIAEPVGRNTAPAIGLAASIIARYDPAGVMLVLPADHYIVQEEKFRTTVLKAREAALNGYLVTMGIVPARPETGFGYIEAEMEERGAGPYPVRRFVEKPNLAKAVEFLDAGNFYWNSGMFIWRADVILDNLLAHMPELSAVLARLTFSDDVWELGDLQPQIEGIYRDIRGESIDFGVMERADNVVVIPADFGWSDVGSWSALPEVMEPDQAGNVAIGVREELALDAGNCLVYGGGKVAALIGVQDLIVVDTPDALLVCHRDRAQDVKRIVEELEKRGLSEYL